MRIERLGNLNVYFAAAEGPALSSEQDALDLIGETYGQEIDVIVVPAARFTPLFFQLSNQQAGHFFQKMQNYLARLVILGDISAYSASSKALRDFVSETNRIGHHLFAATESEMQVRLCGKA
ncbi:alpha/beta hydrolase [Advenella kashmirensis WT001]|uniref:Alpha/beta hydrolase n=1 Tax=Advenella kashmirensis (strain DSM 17095 / LMG 22695 / WT001) TaxID=1036672 RepID=I3UAF4_ADVKW|nr:DUF4180 domain-containing protein [Advenella kashmirensis]AFK61992.1 alpha/beta hydrolase [Advenella kashmirensis WT001]